jgi:hypothetical protein
MRKIIIGVLAGFGAGTIAWVAWVAWTTDRARR